MGTPQELLKAYVQSQNFSSTADIMVKEDHRYVTKVAYVVLGNKDIKKLVADLKKIYTAVTNYRKAVFLIQFFALPKEGDCSIKIRCHINIQQVSAGRG